MFPETWSSRDLQDKEPKGQEEEDTYLNDRVADHKDMNENK